MNELEMRFVERDICTIAALTCCDFDLLGSRDVTSHVNISLAICGFL